MYPSPEYSQDSRHSDSDNPGPQPAHATTPLPSLAQPRSLVCLTHLDESFRMVYVKIPGEASTDEIDATKFSGRVTRISPTHNMRSPQLLSQASLIRDF